MKSRTGISTFEYLLVLIGLTAAAAAAVYFLYLRPPSDREAGREIAVQKTAPAPRPQPRLTHHLTPEEQKAREMAAVLSESAKASDSRPSAPVETSLSAQPSGAEPAPSAAGEAEKGSPPDSAQTEATLSGAAETGTPVVSKPTAAVPAPEKEVLPSKAKIVWVINVLSTLDEDRALRLMDALMKLPYHVYSYQKEIKGQNWYRIRVGFFDSRAEAERVGVKLARDHHLPPPWIVKPGSTEIHRYYQPK